LVGAVVSRGVEDRVLLLVFAGLAFAGAVMLLLPLRTEDQPASRLTVNRPLAVAIAVVLGFFGGLVGIGGVAFILATLIYLLAVPVRIAIGTSLGIGMFAAVAALVGKAATAQIDPPLAAIVFVAALVASPIGAAVSVRTQPRLLLLILAVVVALGAVPTMRDASSASRSRCAMRFCAYGTRRCAGRSAVSSSGPARRSRPSSVTATAARRPRLFARSWTTRACCGASRWGGTRLRSRLAPTRPDRYDGLGVT